jgi:hypothetical protein
MGEPVALIGYGPDLDSRTPGVLTNCAGLVPSLKGMEGALSPQSTLLPALAAVCYGASVGRKLDNTTRLFAGSATKLYEAGSSSWTDRTRAAGGDYALATNNRWRFAQFGDIALAVAKSDILQSSSAGAFANNAANAPKAAVVEVANGFIFLFDVNDQGAIYDSAERTHGWWAAKTSGTWTPSVANQAYTGELTSTPGPIRAGRRFGKGIVAYKDQSMYLGYYRGQQGWDFDLVPGLSGAPSQEAVVDVGTADNPVHIFMGYEDFYSFDGARPVSIGNPLSRTVFGELNRQYAYCCTSLHDRVRKRIHFFYPVGSSGNPDKCVVYNYRTGKWGRDDRTIEATVEYTAAGMTYDDLGSTYTKYDDLPSLSYDFAFLSLGASSPAIFDTTHKIQTMTGTPRISSATLWDMGADELVSLLSRVQPVFLRKPDAATMTNFYRANLGDALTQDQTVNMDTKGRFDVLRSANWHRPRLDFNGDVEIPAVRADIEADGDE